MDWVFQFIAVVLAVFSMHALDLLGLHIEGDARVGGIIFLWVLWNGLLSRGYPLLGARRSI